MAIGKLPASVHTDKVRQKPSLWRTYLLVGVCTAGVVAVILHGVYISEQTSVQQNSLLCASMEIRLEATIAHLWLEEMLSGDRSVNEADIWEHMDEADWFATAMLEGGISYHGTYYPLKDVQMRRQAKRLQEELREFREIATRRLAKMEGGGIGSEIKQEYDAVFNEFFANAKGLEVNLKRQIDQRATVFDKVQKALIWSCLVLALLVGLRFERFIREQRSREKELEASNKRLECETFDLKEAEKTARRHLAEMKFLSTTAMEFVDLQPETDVYELIGRQLKEIVGDPIVVISTSEKSNREVIVRAILGVGKRFEAALKILGRNPVGMSFPMQESFFSQTTSGNLIKLPEGIGHYTAKRIPKTAAKLIEKTLGLGDMYSIRFSRAGTMFAVATIMMRKGDQLENRGLIETYINQASILLQNKQAEEKLREEQEKAQEYLDLAGAMFVAIDSDGVVTMINKKGCEVLGYQEDEVVGKNWFEHFISQGIRGDLDAISKQLLEGQVQGAEYNENAILTKSGEERIIAWHNTVLRDEEGQIIGHLSSGEDITERKRAQEEIESLAKFPAEDPNPVLRISKEGRIIYANQASAVVLEIWQCKEGEVLPEPCASRAREAFESGKPLEFDLECGEQTFSMTLAPVPEAGYLNAYAHDVSERQRAEQRLRDSEDKYRILLENIPQRVFLKDRDSCYVSCNENYARDLGIRPEEIIGKTDYDFYPIELAKKYREGDRRIVDSGEMEDFEETHDRDGRKITVHLVKTPVEDEHGEVIGVLGVFGDITERKKVEERLRAAEATTRQINQQLEVSIERANLMAEQAMAADITKSEFLANMSHEIRTPMTAILGYTDLLTDGTLSAKERGEHLSIIRSNGEHLLKLINDILDLSKIEARKLEIEIQPCSLPSIIAEVISLMRVRAEQGGTSLCVEYTGELPETMLVDGARLRQALINLIGNAVKFAEKGMVKVVVSFVARWHGGDPAVKIEIVDTGIGIEKERLGGLFEAFVQADASTSRRYGGTGLGLAITKRIAKLLGGELTAESVPGEGSVFTLTLPTGALEGVRMLEHPEDVEQSFSSTDLSGDSVTLLVNSTLSGKRILLAEDGPDNQRLITALLSKAGAEVVLAENGLIAVELATAGEYDLILMDMQMPKMDGYEATEELRDKGFSVPIVAITAHALVSDRKRCLEAGCTDYLSKPIDRSVLINMIIRHTGGVVAAEQGKSQEATVGWGGEGIRSEYADDVDMVEIIEQFVRGLAEQLRAMREALANNHHEELQRLAHQLKGAGGSYGYPVLTEAAKTLEDACKAEDVELMGMAISELGKLCEAVVNGPGMEVVCEEANW